MEEQKPKGSGMEKIATFIVISATCSFCFMHLR